MSNVLPFTHQGRHYEVRASVIGGKWVVRVFCDGDAVPGVAYSAAPALPDPPVILMQMARREVECGNAARNARIAAAADKEVELLRQKTAIPTRPTPRRKKRIARQSG
jgi:hypothetical protein